MFGFSTTLEKYRSKDYTEDSRNGPDTTQTITRPVLPPPPNHSENARYFLLSSPPFDFPAPTAGYSSTVCTVRSCRVREKIAQIIRKQTNKNRFLFLSLPSSSNKATSQTMNHAVAIICPYQRPRTCYFFRCACRREKNVLRGVSHRKGAAESIIYLSMQGVSRRRLLLNCTFLQERILTREKSHCMFNPNIFRLW